LPNTHACRARFRIFIEDCTLTVSLSDNFGLSVTFNGTIVNNGNEIFVIQTDEFSVVTGNGKKVSGN